MSGVYACPMLPCGFWAHNVRLGESQDVLIVCCNEISNLECRSMGHRTCSGISQTVSSGVQVACFLSMGLEITLKCLFYLYAFVTSVKKNI